MSWWVGQKMPQKIRYPLTPYMNDFLNIIYEYVIQLSQKLQPLHFFLDHRFISFRISLPVCQS